MRIYIRHADKEYSNGDAEVHKHDPPTTEGSHGHCHHKAAELVQRYGLPFVIVCSPYQRTRETALRMAEFVKVKYSLEVPIKVDVRLSEYLGNRREEALDVRGETLRHDPPHPEHFHEMDSRVRWHNDIFRKLDDFPEVVWFVTHGFIINRIGNAMGFKIPHRISYLSSVSFLVPQARSETRCELNNGAYWSTIYRD